MARSKDGLDMYFEKFYEAFRKTACKRKKMAIVSSGPYYTWFQGRDIILFCIENNDQVSMPIYSHVFNTHKTSSKKRFSLIDKYWFYYKVLI